MKKFIFWAVVILILVLGVIYRIIPKRFVSNYLFKNKEVVEIVLKDFEIKKEDKEWFVKSKKAYKADKSKIDELLNNLQNFQLLEVVSKSTTSYESYSLTEDEALKFSVVCKTKKNKIEKQTIYLGKVGGFSYSEIYARLDKQPQVFLATGIDKWELQRKFYDFCDKTVIKFNKEEVVYIKADFDKKILELKKELKEQTTSWVKIKDKKLVESNKVDEVLENFKDFIGDTILEEIDLGNLELKITFRFNDESEVVLNFYKKTTEGVYPLKLTKKLFSSQSVSYASEEDIIYGIYEWRFQNIKEKLVKL